MILETPRTINAGILAQINQTPTLVANPALQAVSATSSASSTASYYIDWTEESDKPYPDPPSTTAPQTPRQTFESIKLAGETQDHLYRLMRVIDAWPKPLPPHWTDDLILLDYPADKGSFQQAWLAFEDCCKVRSSSSIVNDKAIFLGRKEYFYYNLLKCWVLFELHVDGNARAFPPSYDMQALQRICEGNDTDKGGKMGKHKDENEGGECDFTSRPLPSAKEIIPFL